MEKDLDLLEYSKTLDTLAKRKWEGIISNKDHDHAVIALTKIMDYTEKKFILFDENLSGDIINRKKIVSFEDSLISLLSRKVEVYIILSHKGKKNDNEEILKFFENLKKNYQERLHIKLASFNFKKEMKDIFKQKISFVIADNNKFRIELLDDSDNPKRRAKVSFNNSENVKLINDRINTIGLDSLDDYFK